MSHKRKRLPYWVARRPGFFLYPHTEFHTLSDRLGAPPTTGAMIIDFVVSSTAASIDLYGFDFFSSLSLTGRRTAAQLPHDFAAEKAWVQALADRDPRLKISHSGLRFGDFALAQPVAFAVHLEAMDVVGQAIENGACKAFRRAVLAAAAKGCRKAVADAPARAVRASIR